MLPQRQSGHAEQAGRDIQTHLQELIQFLNKLGQSAVLATKRQLDSRQGLRITKGNHNKVVYGQTSRGFRNELTSQDVEALRDLIKQQPVEREGAEPKGAANYQIKYHGKTLLRQEQNGELTVNEAPLLGFVNKIEPGVATLEDYKQAFASLEDESGESDDEFQDNQEEVTEGLENNLESNNELLPQPEIDNSSSFEDQNNGYEEGYDPPYYDENHLLPSVKSQVNNSQQFVKTEISDFWSIDTDGDGLTDGEEKSFGTDSLSPDTDRDGISDLSELQGGTNPVVDSSTSQEEILSNDDNLLNTKSEILANTTEAVGEQLNRLDNNKITVKEALTTLVSKGKELFQAAGQFTLDRINPLSQYSQEKAAASIALTLLKDNFEKTGATKYEGVEYNISQKSYNKYEITDKAGNIKLSFQNNFTGIKINESDFGVRDYQTFTAASKTLKNTKGAVLNSDLENQLNSLKGLAKETDRQQYLDIQGQEVVKIANNFLHHAGTKMWDRAESNYRIASDKKTFLTIEAKDGRGTILSYTGNSFKQNLSFQDIKHFQKLDVNVKNLVAQKQQKLSQQQGFIPEVKTKIPTINKERELSL